MRSTRIETSALVLAVIALVLLVGSAQASPFALPEIVEKAIASPAIHIPTPPDGATIDGTSPIVVQFELGEGRTPTKVELYVDSELYASNPIRSAAGKSVFYLDTTRFGNGEHTLSAVVYDAQSYSWYSLSSIVISNAGGKLPSGRSGDELDITDPTISIVRPTDGSVARGVIDILIAAGDNLATPMVTIFVDKKVKAITNRPPYTWTWDTRLYSDGQHLIEAWAYDQSQNRGVASPISVIVANSNPLTGGEEILDPGNAGTEVAAVPTKIPVVGPPVVAVIAPLAQGYVLAASAETAMAAHGVPNGTAPAVDAPVSVAPVVGPAIATPLLTNPLQTGYMGLAGVRTASAPMASPAAPNATAPTSSEAEKTVVVSEAVVVAPIASTTKAPIAGAPTVTVNPTEPTASSPAVVSVTPSKPVKSQPPAVKPTASGPRKDGVQMASAGTSPLVGRVVGTTGPRMLDRLFVVFDSTPITFDVKPIVREGTVVAPFRQIFEHTGGTVKWVRDLKIVNAKNDKVSIEFRIGDRTAAVNADQMMMQLTPFIQDGRAMVPISFIRDALGLEMEYDPSTGRVYLSSQ